MNRRKRTLPIVAILVFLLTGLPCWRLYRQVEQARKDQALIDAIKAGDDRHALELLDAGADGDARDMGEAPSFRQVLLPYLDLFRHSGASQVGGQTNKEHLTALLILFQQFAMNTQDRPGPDKRLVRALLDHHAHINDRDANGYSSLWWASVSSNVDAVRLLLDRGADTEMADNWGQTPLMVSSNAGITKALLAHDARIEATDENQNTALACAVTGGDPEAVKVLLEHGANVSHHDKDGRTALDWIQGNTDPDSHKIEALLRKYGAQ